MNSKQAALYIDFDGVIHDIGNPVPGRRMGPPIEGSKEALMQLKTRGYRLVIFTIRADSPKHVEDWLKYYEIPFDEVTNVKGAAVAYIDDKALRFVNWATTLSNVP